MRKSRGHLRAFLLSSCMLAVGCHAITEDYKTVDWFIEYESGTDVPATDFCFDFYVLICYKFKECYPESPNAELTIDTCAHSYYDEYCDEDYLSDLIIKGHTANTCLDAFAKWTCADFERYMYYQDTPEECENPYEPAE